jgi:hypothetical protein
MNNFTPSKQFIIFPKTKNETLRTAMSKMNVNEINIFYESTGNDFCGGEGINNRVSTAE